VFFCIIRSHLKERVIGLEKSKTNLFIYRVAQKCKLLTQYNSLLF